VLELRGYVDALGRRPFSEWFGSLDHQAAARVTIGMARMEQGNFSNVKSVGSGVSECRIDVGPGYRIYLGKDGDRLIILLGGGTKKRQQKDIENAKACWADYKRRKKGEE
jgi:putative addiction module killer protein